MEEATSREKVLKRVRNALLKKEELPFPSLNMEASVFHPLEDLPEIVFAQRFTDAAGKFVYCENQSELIRNLKEFAQEYKWEKIFCRDEKLKKLAQEADLEVEDDESELTRTKVALTDCEYLIARFGSILITGRQASGRQLAAFPDHHIVVARTGQTVNEIHEALSGIKSKYGRMPSTVTMITGPSRTADIEKTLVMGAHGPRELFLFLLDEAQPA
ncbi:MAG: hypothetical protein Kow00127_19170 [Bacteroidales bacterium]